MEDSVKTLYREIQERFVKVIWTHKIQLCQAAINIKKNKCHTKLIAFLSVLVSASAIINVLRWFPESLMVPLLAVLSLILSFFTALFKSENLEKAAAENEHFAATMHDLRNRYAGLLADIKSGMLSKEQIITRREELGKEENLIYSGIVPYTSTEAVKDAEKALKSNIESTTTQDEIELLISANLQV